MATAADIQDLLSTDKLDDAITQMNIEVRTHPTSVDMRALLAELLCIAGNLERADTILSAISELDPGAAVGVALFRQLVRAEQARQQFFTDGRLPEFISKPGPLLEIELRAAVALRSGSADEVATLLAEREAERGAVAGVADGVPFDDFRDLDDLCAAHLEVLTSTGKYFWVPVTSVTAIEFRKPERRRDLIWRRAHLSVTEGPDGEVFMPSIYVARDSAPGHRLGHVTDYDAGPGGCSFGKGLRTFLVGEHSKNMLEFGKVEFSPASPGT